MLRTEYSSRTGTELPIRQRCRKMARSGTTPEPPAASSSGTESAATPSHTK
jgi:hypothetical protein